MQTFKVGAVNKYFWQILKCNAVDAEQAMEKVESYLRSPKVTKIEDDEYQMALDAQLPADREDYVYNVSMGAIESVDYVSDLKDVQFIDGGSNG